MNPFPPQGTLSIEGTRVDAAAAEEGLGVGQPTPTLMLAGVSETLRLVGAYLSGYQERAPAGAAASPSSEAASVPNVLPAGDGSSSATVLGRGRAIALHGPHGAGKTHAIRVVATRVAAGNPGPSGGIPNPVQLYAKVEGPDFLLVYQRLMAQVPLKVFTDLSLRFLALAATKQLRDDLPTAAAGDRAAEHLRDDPRQVYSLFQQYFVDVGAVETRQATEISQAVGGGLGDFQRALSYLLDAELAPAAYDWLLGQRISADYLRRLGVSGPMQSPDVAKWGLHLLATLFARVGRPLIIYIDQFEKLIPADDTIVARQNVGLLQTLVEKVPKENGALLLAGNEEAWQALPRDLKQRFANNIVEFPILTLEEALQIVGVYLAASDRPVALSPSDADLHPFNTPAVRQILGLASGNIRRFLQICSSVFESAEGAPVVAETVEQAVKKGAGRYFDRDTVRDTIERALVRRSARFSRRSTVGGVQADFAVSYAAEPTPRLLIQISDALYDVDEMTVAWKHVDIVERLGRLDRPPRFMLVVLGYASPQVIGALGTLVPDWIVYDPEVFDAQLDAVLERTLAVPADASSRQEREALERQVVEVRAELERLTQARQADAKLLEDRLRDLQTQQASTRATTQRDELRRMWAVERQQLEQDILAARAKRRADELAELETLRLAAERARWNAHLLRSGVAGAAGLLLVFVLLFLGSSPVRFDGPSALIYSFVAGALIGTGFGLATWYLEPRALRDLRGSVNSDDDLQRLARAYLASDRASTGIRLLRSTNPHVRYAAALSNDPPISDEVIMRTLLAERSAIVRRRLAQQTAAGPSPRTVPIEFQQLVDFVPETAYIVEIWSQTAANYSLAVQSAVNGPLRTLATIAGADDANSLTGQLVLSLRSHEPAAPVIWALAKAYDSGFDRAPVADLADLSEEEVKAAVRELSPFESGGLGTYDRLRSIAMVDRLYLFFRQCQFLIEHDAFLSPSNWPASPVSQQPSATTC